MSNTLIEQNTDELEKLHEAVKDLPEGITLSDPLKLNPDLNLLVLGDSLFGNGGGRNFIKRLGCRTQNYAVGSATLTEISERIIYSADKEIHGTYNSIGNQFKRFVDGKPPLFWSNSNDVWTKLSSPNWERNFEEPDVILVDGGGNDYMASAALGDVTKSPNIYPTVYSAAPNYAKDTVVGALHALLRDISMTYPKAQRFFLIMHRVYQCNADTLKDGSRRLWSARNTPAIRVPYTRTVDGESVTTWEVLVNSEGTGLVSNKNVALINPVYVREFVDSIKRERHIGYNVGTLEYDRTNLFKDGTITNKETDVDETKIEGRYNYNKLRETIIEVCNMYGFKIIDIYNDSPLNVMPPTENYDNSGYAVANTDFFDWVGIHPTKLGYQIGYEPYVKRALSLATKK